MLFRTKYPIPNYNFYHALCIDKSATQEDIEKAFLKMEETFAHEDADDWAKVIYSKPI